MNRQTGRWLGSAFVGIWVSFYSLSAQSYSIGSNLAGLATTNLNVEASMPIHHTMSLHFPVQYNPFTFSGGRRFQNLTLTPGVRYWLSGLYRGGFCGAHLLASRYHAGRLWDSYRYDGLAFGAGLSVGYTWTLSGRWRFETEAGAGMLWTDYRKYRCKPCGAFLGREEGWHFVPTRVAANLLYLF
jgi:hypothetical protein